MVKGENLSTIGFWFILGVPASPPSLRASIASQAICTWVREIAAPAKRDHHNDKDAMVFCRGGSRPALERSEGTRSQSKPVIASEHSERSNLLHPLADCCACKA